MSFIDIIILSIALGIDCLVVSFSQGLIFKQNKRLNSFILAMTMGLFQGLMPVLSYFCTDFVDHIIQPYSKLLVFTIFMWLGTKFIVDSSKEKELNCFDLKCLITMGFATSIDALASGINLKLTSTPILISAIIIGIVSFLMSLTGFWLGYFFKKLPSRILEIFGGLLLIILAIKNIL